MPQLAVTDNLIDCCRDNNLTILALGAQQASADKFYEIKDAKSLKMNDTSNSAHWVDVK